MKPPLWFTGSLAEAGKRVLAGEMSRAEAVAVLARAVQDRPELSRDIIAGWTAARLDAWLKAAAPLDPAPGAGIQIAMFPGLPRELKITPGRTKPFLAMDAHDLDMAVKLARTQAANSIDGTREWLASIERAYDKVRPLLAGDLTVADVLGEIEGPAAAAAP